MKQAVAVAIAMVILMWSMASAFAEQGSPIPEEVPRDHWSCREIEELGARYQVQEKLPDLPMIPRKELDELFLGIMEQVARKREAEGPEAISREDRERLAALNVALQADLKANQAYLTRQDTFEKILEPPEEVSYLYKIGVKGFLSGEGTANFAFSDFSYTPGHGVGLLLYRIKPYLEWRPADWLELEVDGQVYGYTFNPQHYTRFSLYQAYLELKPPAIKEMHLKIGRQEFVYGSAFILGANSYYEGLTFDAARLRVRPIPELTMDLLAGSYAVPSTHLFDGLLAGAYLTYAPQEGTTAEVYYFRDAGIVFPHPGEHLEYLGLRGTARLGPVSLEVEPVYETGQIANPNSGALDTVNAWGGHVDLLADMELFGFRNTFTVGYAYGSGSQDAADGRSLCRQFSNIDNDTSLTGDMGFIGDLSGVTVNDVHASGLHIVTAGWGINLLKELNFTTTARYFQADRTPAGVSTTLGVETDFILTWTIDEDMALIAAYDRFFTGNFFRDATGRADDMQYGYLMFQFNFSGGKRKMSKR